MAAADTYLALCGRQSLGAGVIPQDIEEGIGVGGEITRTDDIRVVAHAALPSGNEEKERIEIPVG